MKIEEKEIPSLIRQGKDKAVMELLYKNVFPKVRSYISSHNGIKDDAGDVFQDALLFFYNQVIANEFNEEKYKVYGYLFRLSINRWLNKLKKHNRMTLVDDMTTNEFDSSDNENYTSIDFLKREENLIKSLFTDLGDKCIELLNYTIYSNLLLEDVAIRMGMSTVGSVKMQLKRCKEKLYKELEEKPEIIELLTNG